MNKNRKKRYEKIMDSCGRIFLFPLLLTGYLLKFYDKLFKTKKEKNSSAQHKNFSDF
ncbi:MAG: hypothetical protein ACRCTS_02495 [Fusobacteriaceae bacterium]